MISDKTFKFEKTIPRLRIDLSKFYPNHPNGGFYQPQYSMQKIKEIRGIHFIHYKRIQRK